MAQTILIDPVTRIEGHAKITIHLDDQDKVADARLHITQFRGFEKFVEGRPYQEMPSLMSRICGICPVSHLLASAKACDELLAVAIPPTATLLRRIMHMGQIIQSHALSFFHLASPDLLLGLDADPAKRNVFGVLEQHPQLARDGIRLRQFGQEVISLLGGKRIHPAWAVPGGVSAPLSPEHRDQLLAQVPEALQLAQRTLDWYKGVMDNYREEIRTFGNFPSLYLGLVTPKGELELYEGRLRAMNARGEIIADQVEPNRYAEYIEEAVEPDSYLKSPYYKPLGYQQGMYRVGPLARLNLIDACGTPRADEEWAEFRALERGPVSSSFHFHYARLIEILYAVETMEKLLRDERILDPQVRAIARPNRSEGIGISEAPRGTLIHHYRIDENGLMQWANLIIATGHNNLAMNHSILQVARHFVKGKALEEGMLNRVEAVVRAYDPCLSCSTHAVGQMPLQVQLIGPGGELCAEARRD
jgi:NAD-reducing hydrogenase large subunit